MFDHLLNISLRYLKNFSNSDCLKLNSYSFPPDLLYVLVSLSQVKAVVSFQTLYLTFSILSGNLVGSTFNIYTKSIYSKSPPPHTHTNLLLPSYLSHHHILTGFLGSLLTSLLSSTFALCCQ